MSKITKPTTVVVEEFRNDLATIINTSNLPPFVVEPILQEILNEVKVVKQRQYEIDKARYEQALLEDGKEELAKEDSDVKSDEVAAKNSES